MLPSCERRQHLLVDTPCRVDTACCSCGCSPCPTKCIQCYQPQQTVAASALQASNVCWGARGGVYNIPMVLHRSQLPADTTYPLPLTLTLMDCTGEQHTLAARWSVLLCASIQSTASVTQVRPACSSLVKLCTMITSTLRADYITCINSTCKTHYTYEKSPEDASPCHVLTVPNTVRCVGNMPRKDNLFQPDAHACFHLRAGQQGQSGRQLGEWQVTAYKDGRNISVRFARSHKLADYVGYSIAKALLLQDPIQGVRLTIILSSTAGRP